MLGVEGLRRGNGRKASFAKIPDFVQVDRRLVGCDLRLLARLIHYAWGSGVCWPSVRRLAADLSVAERTVQVALGRLYRLGYVRTRPAGNPTGREFVLDLDGAQPAAPPGVNPTAAPPPPRPAPEPDPVPSNQTQENQTERPSGIKRNEPIHEPRAIATVDPARVSVNPSARPSRRDPGAGRSRAGRMTGEEMAAMTRSLAAAGDPAARRELARLERPKPEPRPLPSTVADLIDRLDDDPTFRPRLAAALSDHWSDRKSYEFYWQVAMKEPQDVIARAFAGSRLASSPPAMFTALLRRDPRSRTRR